MQICWLMCTFVVVLTLHCSQCVETHEKKHVKKSESDNDLDIPSGQFIEGSIYNGQDKEKRLDGDPESYSAALSSDNIIWRIYNMGDYNTLEYCGRDGQPTGYFLSGTLKGGKISLVTPVTDNCRWRIVGKKTTGYNIQFLKGNNQYKFVEANFETDSMDLKTTNNGKALWKLETIPPLQSCEKQNRDLQKQMGVYTDFQSQYTALEQTIKKLQVDQDEALVRMEKSIWFKKAFEKRNNWAYYGKANSSNNVDLTTETQAEKACDGINLKYSDGGFTMDPYHYWTQSNHWLSETTGKETWWSVELPEVVRVKVVYIFVHSSPAMTGRVDISTNGQGWSTCGAFTTVDDGYTKTPLKVNCDADAKHVKLMFDKPTTAVYLYEVAVT